jgi:hypothetical protein
MIALATTQAGTVEQMEKLNLFCKLVQEMGDQPAKAKQAMRAADL